MEKISVNTNKKQITCRNLVSDECRVISQTDIDYTNQLFKMRQKLGQTIQLDASHQQTNIPKQLKNTKKRKIKKTQSMNLFEDNFKKLGLKRLIANQKINSIVKNFITKIKRNNSYSLPVQYYPYAQVSATSLWNKNGINIPNWFGLSFSFLSIIQIMVLCFVYTLSLIFEGLDGSSIIQILQKFSMCFYTIQIIMNFLSIKTVDGRKIILLRQIFMNYLKSKFTIDILCLAILFVDINTQYVVTKFLRLCVVFKIKQCLHKMQKIQNFFINNFYKEQYWSLTKVILVNFGFAHFLAILLLAMANLSVGYNWIIKIGIQHSPWYEQYSWAYYWGTTIMLTVGFGDLSAANYKEAICLTMIQTISCILLAYNINCVGNLINNIRTQDYEKNKNLKIMRKLAENNDIKDQLEWKVCNYIDQSDKMKKSFAFQQQKQFISNLPQQFKGQFLKQSNIKIFQNINFFKNFTEKTLLSLAEHVQAKIAHPQQIIFKTEDIPQLLILKEGKIGYCTKLIGSDYCGTIINTVKIGKKEKPQLLYLGFLNENIRNVKYKIKSLKYSMIYYLAIQQVLLYTKNSIFDFESFCQMRDKSKHMVDQFQVIQCENCQTKHSKMSCPKLHFTPIYQLVIYKHLQDVRLSKNERIAYLRCHNRSQLASNNPFRLKSYFQKLESQIYKNKNVSNRNSRICNKSIQNNTIPFYNAAQRKKFRYSSKFHQTQSKIQNKFFQHIIKIFGQKKSEEGKQFFWDIQCDLAHNFKFYFSNSNPSQLCHQVILFSKFHNQANKLQRLPLFIQIMTGLIQDQKQKKKEQQKQEQEIRRNLQTQQIIDLFIQKF